MKKLKLTELKLKSFITKLPTARDREIRGGGSVLVQITNPIVCKTLVPSEPDVCGA